MCGIHLSMSRTGHESPSQNLRDLLSSRGPDCSCTRADAVAIALSSADGETTGQVYLTATASVLSLRGDHTVRQPVTEDGDDESGSFLCWNGEAWSIGGVAVAGNDTKAVYDLLRVAVSCTEHADPGSLPSGSETCDASLTRVATAIRDISGPFSFIFFDAPHRRLFFGRDCLGRRSLLRTTTVEGCLVLSSISDTTQTTSAWEEVDADEISVLDLQTFGTSSGNPRYLTRLPRSLGEPTSHTFIPSLRRDIAPAVVPLLDVWSPAVSHLELELTTSLEARLKNVPDPPRLNGNQSSGKVSLLFSGGLDCTVLARLAHGVLPLDEPIHLLNVAFENPRVVAASKLNRPKTSLDTAEGSYEECPDRITGRKSLSELCEVCPERQWIFLAINVPYVETLAHRQRVISLMHPHNTEMDLSISYALYFAARGSGRLDRHDYTNPTRVLLSGLGADELFAGYTRHATAFSRRGFPGLLDELDLDITRLGKRNLGRDDRIISHWAKEVRYPYLDESLVRWAMERPVWEKCGFGQVAGGQHEKCLEPGKRVLRLLAWRLGMKGVATEKKRAMQFGARTAKMEAGRTTGTQILS